MTACLVNLTANNQLVLAADTLVTSTEPIVRNMYATEYKDGFKFTGKIEENPQNGFTATGQRFIQLPNYQDGTFTYFGDVAAKVGIINGLFPFCCAGDAGAIFEFLHDLFRHEHHISDKDRLEVYVKTVIDNIQFTNRLGNLQICFGFALPDGVPSIAMLKTTPEKKEFSIIAGNGTNWLYSFGSGAQSLQRYDSRISVEMSETNPEMHDMLGTFVMSDLANLFADPFSNPVPRENFGGAFLALGIKDGAIVPPKRYVHLYVDQDDTVVFALKVHFENGFFHIHDLLGNNVSILESVDNVVRKPHRELDLSRVGDISKHEASWMFVTYQNPDSSTTTEIVGDGTQNVFKSPLWGPLPEGYNADFWFGPGVQLEITENGVQRMLNAKPRGN